MNPGPDRSAIVTVVLASAFALAIGFAVGFIATFTHHALPPWGLLAGLAIVVALVAGFRLVFSSRIIGAAAALGAIGASALLTLPGAGGVIFPLADPIGYIWASAPAVLSAIVIAWPTAVPRREGAAARSRMDP